MVLIKWKITDETVEEWMAIEDKDGRLIYIGDVDHDAMYYSRDNKDVKYIVNFIKRLDKWHV